MGRDSWGRALPPFQPPSCAERCVGQESFPSPRCASAARPGRLSARVLPTPGPSVAAVGHGLLKLLAGRWGMADGQRRFARVWVGGGAVLGHPRVVRSFCWRRLDRVHLCPCVPQHWRVCAGVELFPGQRSLRLCGDGESLRYALSFVLSRWSSFSWQVEQHRAPARGRAMRFWTWEMTGTSSAGCKTAFLPLRFFSATVQSWTHSAESLLPVSARYRFKISWDALIWESRERGPGEAEEEMLLALLESLFTDQLLFSSFVLLRNSYIVFAFCTQLSTSISLSALQRAINSVLQISLSNCWTLWLIVMQHISLRTINLY